MSVTEIVAIMGGIGSLIAIIISAFALIQKTVESRRNSRVLEAANVVTGYSQLCDDLQRQIEANNAEIARLRLELAELRKQSQADREAWEAERADLQEQIRELQEENKRLRSELEKLTKGGG